MRSVNVADFMSNLVTAHEISNIECSQIPYIF